MNEKYTLDPKSFSNSIELKYIMEKFGFAEGRFIAEYPSHWRRSIFDRLHEFPEIEQLRIKRILEIARANSLLRCGLSYNPQKTWTENSLAQLTSQSINGIISSNTKAPILDFNLSDFSLPDSRGTRIKATPKNLVDAAESLITCSAEIYLIDPYTTLAKQSYISFFKELLTRKSSHNKNFIVYTRHNNFECKKNPRTIADEELKPLLQGSSVEFITLEDNNEIHSRNLFSLRGGIKYDKGFQVDQDRIVDLETMSKNLLNDYIHLYNEKNHSHKIIDNFKIQHNEKFA